MSWMPCPNYSCSENVGGQCFGDGCQSGGYKVDPRVDDDFSDEIEEVDAE